MTSNRRSLVAGLICAAVLIGIGLILDINGVRFASTLIPALAAAFITVFVMLVVRRHS